MHGHSEEQKLQAVADYLAGDPIKDILRRYRIVKSTLWHWTREMHGDAVKYDRKRGARARLLDNPKKSDGWKPPGAWR